MITRDFPNPIDSNNIQIRWFIENHILLVKIKSKLTTADFQACSVVVPSIADKTPTPIMHVMVDFSDVRSIPNMVDLTRRPFPRHPKLGWLLLVNLVHPEIQIIANLACKILKFKYQVHADRQSALDFLYQVDPTLPPPDSD